VCVLCVYMCVCTMRAVVVVHNVLCVCVCVCVRYFINISYFPYNNDITFFFAACFGALFEHKSASEEENDEKAANNNNNTNTNTHNTQTRTHTKGNKKVEVKHE